MANDTVTKFVSGCAQLKEYSPAKLTEIGPTIWLLGAPAPAPDGMVGLATTSTQTICFFQEDILDARETEGRFLINIAADTNLLVREEQVIKLNPGGCECPEQSEASAIRVGGPHAPNTGPIIIDCTPVCGFELVCRRHTDPGTGTVIMVCFPQFVCRNPCAGIPV